MKKLRTMTAAMLIILFLATPAFAAGYWDGFFTNFLSRGVTRLGALELSSVTHVFNTLADWTLSATEALKTILVTSSGSGGASIVAPNESGRVYVVRNAGTGAVTIKISGGSGVSVAIGKTAMVWHNGTDYVRITADATH